MARRAAGVSHRQKSESQEDTSREELLHLVQRAKDAGITLSVIQQGITGSPQALKKKLLALVKEGAIEGPINYGTPKRTYYFAAGMGPSVHTVSAKLVRLVKKSGSMPASLKQLQKEITGIESVFLKQAIQQAVDANVIRGPYGSAKYYLPIDGPTVESVSEKVAQLAKNAGSSPPSDKLLKKEVQGSDSIFLMDAIELAVRNHAVLALNCGGTMFYLHADVAATFSREVARPLLPDLALEDILPAYRRIKTRQSGRSTVKIYDLLQELHDREVSKEAVHKLLIAEGRKGRVSNHHASVQLPQDVVDAGFWLPDFEEPFVTFTIRSEQ